MSNPSINRWGLNLFWYNYWYSDTNKSFQIHQDDLLTRLLYTYLNYGVLGKPFKFSHIFWNFTNKKFYLDYLEKKEEDDIQYYRFSQYRNKLTKEKEIIRFRLKRKNLYFTKFWIMRYDNWLIVNIYSLQPLKKRYEQANPWKKSKKEKLSQTHPFFITFKIPNLHKSIARQLLIFKFFNNQESTIKNLYLF